MPNDLELDVGADEVVQLTDQVVRCLSGQDPSVELELDLARDDVDLVAAVHDRRADGVADDAAQLAPARSERTRREVCGSRIEQAP